ncbi:MAG: molybdate ABC transporter substrate-binding protein [Armatimonadetes bacterium]|nr:molybdate ABC transporter substrate-binding protein [Armatimonadota bacterium]NIM24213.1 molybdate ABC transporter substrate-binding protein [Armatimonadota bacterium]NIM68082.1 molybdate ABC transporter substrate-binding protein [Armatimonadota bacterium]NIM76544.1 molybdate ABC transporter substrate-binding protein [Armatimonadota bacterium]NIN06287.1 molybdate ABC transporter substrate-binding protein [Armatimonadota bacterium]
MISRHRLIGGFIRGLILLTAMSVMTVVLFGCQGAQQTGTQTSSAQEEKVYIYIPCGMREPFDHAISMFNETHPGPQIQPYFDNAVVLVRKIKDGDRPDLVVSPGKVEMLDLDDDGLIDTDSITDIGTYTLVLIVPRDNPGEVKSLQDLTKPSVRTVAIAEPSMNSVGLYGKESLESLGLWEKIKGKVINPEHALDAVTFTATAKVDATLAYETCPLQSAPEKASKEKVKIIEEVSAGSHSPIEVKIGVLKESPNPERAKEFVKFLTTEEVQATFQETGLPRISNLTAASACVVE